MSWAAAAQAKAGDVKGALQTARAIKDGQTKNYVLLDIVEAKAKTGDIKDALQTASPILDGEFKDCALENIAMIQSASGDEKSAIAWAVTKDWPSGKFHALRGIAQGISARLRKSDLRFCLPEGKGTL